MKTILTTLFFVGAMTGAAFAFTSTGAVASWNAASGTVKLNDGESFTIPQNVKHPEIMKGEKITVTYDSKATKHVTDVEKAEAE